MTMKSLRIFALLTLLCVPFAAFAAQVVAPTIAIQPECSVTGRVTKVEAVQKSPWNDGTPTTLTTTEIRLHLQIENRQGGKGCEPYTGDQALRIYKLCSPTRVAVGDNVKGTEGLSTGTAGALGCLFDVALVNDTSKKTSP